MNDKDARESEELQRLKVKHMKKCQEMATREDNEPRKSKCSALKGITKVALVTALGLLGHAVQDGRRLEAEMRRPPPVNYVSVPAGSVTNMTEYIKLLEKTNAELVRAQDTLNKLIENNPTNPTQPYSKAFWMKDQIKRARGETEQGKKKVDDSKAVVTSSKAKKGGKGRYFNEHFSLTF